MYIDTYAPNESTYMIEVRSFGVVRVVGWTTAGSVCRATPSLF